MNVGVRLPGSVKTLIKHPVARYVVLFVVALLSFFWWLTGTLLGVLCASIALYYAWPHFTSTQPMPVSEAIGWAATHDPQSFLTVLGFVVAYMLSIAAWKRQKAMEIRLDSATDILQFFQAASRETQVLELFASELNSIQARLMIDPPIDLTFEANYAASRMPAVDDMRRSLSQRGIEVHLLRTRHELVVSGSIGTMLAFDKAQKALESITQAMWFPMPLGAQNPEHFLDIVKHSDARKWAHFERVGGESRVVMSAASAGLKGFAQGSLLRPGLASFIRLWSTSKSFHTQDD